MKRSELKVGNALYYARGRDWEIYEHSGQKAIVVDTEPYSRIKGFGFYGEDGKPWRRDPKGTLVLVDIESGQYTHRDVVSLASLKGPYDKVAAEVAARAAARQERRQAADEEIRQQQGQRDRVLARAEQAGVKASSVYQSSQREQFVMLPVDELARLLDLLEG